MRNKKTPPHGRGGTHSDRLGQEYAPRSPRSSRMWKYLNPRRQQAAEKLLLYIRFQGGKLILADSDFTATAARLGLPVGELRTAAQDLHQVGRIEYGMAGVRDVLRIPTVDHKVDGKVDFP